MRHGALVCGGLLVVGAACGGGPPSRPPAAPASPAPASAELPTEATPVSEPIATPAPVEGPPACRPGMVRQDHWPGEWPEPILYLEREVVLEGVLDPCTTGPKVACAVAPGVYHPWSAATTGADFASLSKRAVYESSRGFNVLVDGSPRSYPPGTRVYGLGYLGEGFCSFWVDGHTTEWMCPDVADEPEGPGLRVLEAGGGEAIRLFGAMCAGRGGERVWIAVDDALLGTSGVGRGVFVEYGEVGPPGAAKPR